MYDGQGGTNRVMKLHNGQLNHPVEGPNKPFRTPDSNAEELEEWTKFRLRLPVTKLAKRDDRKKILSRLKVMKHLSRSPPFQGVHKVRRQFVTRCYYDHSVLTQIEPV
ncbi:hypothetical protein DPMN_116557 [Dreissena polymorpha]|uniref:Uncharacterized protein n=1 Tax=Dreissena polymorpha TaxID=45954 RepID=A0A9D4KN90_DREPO|nr:hypothetical protein DPMN_116557 [Dreissena polymorpha]